MPSKPATDDAIVSVNNIQAMIFTIRGVQVMIDRDLADAYGVENKRLNEQVKRNIARFPEAFRFQLTDEEKNKLVANCDRFDSLKHSTFRDLERPFVFLNGARASRPLFLNYNLAKMRARRSRSKPPNETEHELPPPALKKHTMPLQFANKSRHSIPNRNNRQEA